MALLRSDVLNKDLLETVLKKIEGTKKVSLSAITVGGDEGSSLLEERFSVVVEAKVKGSNKIYHWIAKLLKADQDSANLAKFQGLLETEICFYTKFVPELSALGAPIPAMFPLVHGDYRSTGREVILLQDVRTIVNKDPMVRRITVKKGFSEAIERGKNDKEGHDLAHVVKVMEWLARLHGLGYVLLQKHSKGSAGYLRENPWIRKEIEELREQKESTKIPVRQRLTAMAASAVQDRLSPDSESSKMLQRQDWLNDLKKELLEKRQSNSFWTICHGEPWARNTWFQYKTDRDGYPYPTEALLADFHAATYGSPGSDLAHYLLTSTTRKFRKEYLTTVLKSYHTELEDVIQSQGLDELPYSQEDLKSDYKNGMVTGISFCLFAMPLLRGANGGYVRTVTELEDQVDGQTLVEFDPVMTERFVDAILELNQDLDTVNGV